MLTTILTGITAYISTSIDYLIILMVIFGATPKRHRFLVYLGDFLGTAILVLTSYLMAVILGFVPAEWLLGFLGLIPILMGVKLLIFGEKEDDDLIENEIQKKTNVVLKVAIITIATCGADNIGIYVPLFTQISPTNIPILLVTFFIMMTLFCYLGYLLSKIPTIGNILEKWSRYITAVVYIGLGIYILWESGTLTHLIQLL